MEGQAHLFLICRHDNVLVRESKLLLAHPLVKRVLRVMFVSWANIYSHSAAIGQKFRGGTMLPTMNETCIQGSEGLSLWTSFVRRNVLTWDLIQQGSVKFTFFCFYNILYPTDGSEDANHFCSLGMRCTTDLYPTICEPAGCAAMGQERQRSIRGACARKRTKLAETTGGQTRILRYASSH